MVFPNYEGKSILNLIASIRNSCNYKTNIKELDVLSSKELKKYTNVVLMLFDGMGYEFFKKNYVKNSLNNFKLNKLTSVFPSTTSAVITSIFTGVPPIEHGFFAWTLNFKEIGCVSNSILFKAKFNNKPFSDIGLKFTEICNQKSMFSLISQDTHIINHKDINPSDYNTYFNENSFVYSYDSLNGFFNQTKKAITFNSKKKIVYSYYPFIDSFSHHFGTKSKKTIAEFNQIIRLLNKLVKSLKGTNTKLLITADHGLIDYTKKEVLFLEDYPHLKECLSMPLCGEGRSPFCYVYPSKKKDFLKIIKTEFKDKCNLYSREQILKKKLFGQIEDKTYIDRIGDYVLIMKKNYVLKDQTLGSKKSEHLASHGGTSKEEMYIPLIEIDC